MKRIEAIIRPAKVNDVYKALEEVGHPGLMISEIEGHGVEGKIFVHPVDNAVRVRTAEQGDAAIR